MSSTLQEQFPASQVLLPDSEQYEEYNSSYLAAQQSEIRPSAIFQPKSAEEVARFVKMSAAGGFAFAVRGGGQNPLPHSSNIEKPGITLDLALLNSVKLGEGSISVGAGARWGAVYEALEGMGLGVSGNRSGKGGIGGLALQGETF